MKQFLQLSFKPLYRFLTEPAHRRFMWLALRFGNKKRFVATRVSIDGLQLELPDGPSFIWQYRDIFSEQNYKFQASERPLILDCGANIGSSVLYFARLFPKARIEAWEADPNVFAYLQRNVARNTKADVVLHNAAIWTHKQGIRIASEGADGGGIFADGNEIEVPSVRLRDVLLQHPHIDMLKMDIEGAEHDVLPDCADALSNVQHVFVEYHSYVGRPQGLGRIIDVLEQAGFRYFVRPEADRLQPFVQRNNRSNAKMDLQLNVFAYRV